MAEFASKGVGTAALTTGIIGSVGALASGVLGGGCHEHRAWKDQKKRCRKSGFVLGMKGLDRADWGQKPVPDRLF